MFFGDMYYSEMMSVEETMEKAFTYFSEDKMLKTQEEVDLFCRDNVNDKIPLDGP